MSNWWDDHDPTKRLRDELERLNRPMKALESVYAQIDQLKSFAENPAMKAARELDESSRRLGITGLQADFIKNLETAASQLPAGWEQAIAQARKTHDVIEALSTSFVRTIHPPQWEGMLSAREYVQSTGVQRLLQEHEKQSGAWASLDAWHTLADYVTAAAESYDDDSVPTSDQIEQATLGVNDELEGWVQDDSSLDEFFAAFVAKLSQAPPLIARLMLHVLAQIILTVITNAAAPAAAELLKERFDDVISLVSPSQPRKALKRVSRTAATKYPRHILESHRVVTVAILSVHATHGQRAPEIGSLTLGTPVRIIAKQKDWSKIEYFDHQTGHEEHGWVLARYLSKFEE